MRRGNIILTATLAAAVFLCGIAPSHAQSRLTAEQAGTISDNPGGRIAFIRERNVWVMEWSGANKRLVSEVGNADGRIAWSPDDTRLLFPRSGRVDLRRPAGLGGFHKVYDLFIADLDSMDVNTFWWRGITDDMGSRDPEWLDDGRILFFKDLNANLVNADGPNYQVCLMDSTGSGIEILRQDWQTVNLMTLTPTYHPQSGKVAFEVMFENNRQGWYVLDQGQMTMRPDSLRVLARGNQGYITPSFSPDGQWIAHIYNSPTESAVWISPSDDITQRFLVYEPPVSASVNPNPPSFSPDSKWLTFSTTDGSIWICDITGGQLRRVSGPGTDANPTWSSTSRLR